MDQPLIPRLPDTGAGAPAIIVEGLCTDFLQDVSFTVQPGETAVVFGRSGCGKSTLVRALVNLVPRRSGTVQGVDRAFAFIPQDMDGSVNPRLRVDRVVTESVALTRGSAAARAARAQVPALLNQLGLSQDLASRKPRSLSGGQRARIGIARALMANPRVIIADEPLAALDEASRQLATALLTDTQRTVILVSHDVLGMAEVCDRWFVMDAGRIVETGRSRSVLDLSDAHPARRELVDAARRLSGGED